MKPYIEFRGTLQKSGFCLVKVSTQLAEKGDFIIKHLPPTPGRPGGRIGPERMESSF